jgi:hypothetical protein
MNEEQQPDWDNINRGKVRHFFALELYKYKLRNSDKAHLKPTEIGTIEMYVEYVMNGAEFRELIKEKSALALMSRKECEDIITARLRDVDSITPEEHARAIIHLEADGLKDNDLKAVLEALDAGKINQDNLKASVDKISNIKSEYDKE